jgi:hypothetical protein
MTAGAVLCASCAVAIVKRFVNTCYKGERGVIKGVVYYKDKAGKQRHKELITSPVKVELRRL